MIINDNTALILVDIQNDFCPGGSLAVPKGDEIVNLANQLQPYFPLIVATQDWHPQDHMSFASNHPAHKIGDVIEVHGIMQVLWPDHCVQQSKGAEFHPDLDISRFSKVVHKGVDRNIDSYSAFFDNEHSRSTGLYDYLNAHEIDEIYVMGLATDYCVKYSCLDAVRLGLKVNVIKDGCRGIDLKPGDVKQAFDEMEESGINIVESGNIL